MAVPVFAGPYTPQADVVDAAVAFDVSAGWTGADFFELDTLPSEFTFATPNIGGFARVDMDYTLFIRGVNADGKADFEPLTWTVTGGAGVRKLWGLSLVYQNVHLVGTPAVLYIQLETNRLNPTRILGSLLINDIGDSITRDGTSARYPAGNPVSQILISGGSNTFARATLPGMEIVIDTAV